MIEQKKVGNNAIVEWQKEANPDLVKPLSTPNMNTASGRYNLISEGHKVK
jgi:hypothetical protein